MTARSLLIIAEAGGPRCCKRNSFLAISEAVRFSEEELRVRMESGPASINCEFHDLNKECRKSACPFYPHAEGHDPAESRMKPFSLNSLTQASTILAS